MPPNMVDTAAEEKAWKRAKARAAKEGHAEDWPYVVAIFQAMTGKKGTAKGARLDPSTGMGDPSTWTTAVWKGGGGHKYLSRKMGRDGRWVYTYRGHVVGRDVHNHLAVLQKEGHLSHTADHKQVLDTVKRAAEVARESADDEASGDDEHRRWMNTHRTLSAVRKGYGPLGPIVDVLRKATVADDPDYTRNGDGNPFVVVGGLKIHVEKFPGESRHGFIQNSTYGEVIGVDGADGEAFDVVVGQHRNAPIAYVIDQLDANGALDEHKAMVGWLTPEDAARAYAGQWGAPKMGGMTAIPVADLARCLLNHPQVSAVPFADYLEDCGYTPVRVWVAFTGRGPIASPDAVSANGGMAYGAPGR